MPLSAWLETPCGLVRGRICRAANVENSIPKASGGAPGAAITGESPNSGIGLCLGASLFGFYAHAGFLKGLTELAVRPGHIAATSAGAIAGGLYAAGIEPGKMIEELLAFDFTRAFFELGVPLRGFAMMVNWPRVSGLLTGERLIRVLEREVEGCRLESLGAPRLSIAATNLSDGRSEILTHGSLARAMVASAAVPLLFNAIPLNGHHYWDGGVANALPVATLCDDPAIHTIIVHQILHGREVRARESRAAPSIATAFNVAHQVIGRRIFEIDCAALEASGRRVIHCRTVTGFPSLSRRVRESCVRAGEATAQAQRDELRAALLFP
jgi:predicted acylesterase/phospholipase RssA